MSEMSGVVGCLLLEGGNINIAEAARLRVVCGVEHNVLGAEKDNREVGIVLSTALFNLEIISWQYYRCKI